MSDDAPISADLVERAKGLVVTATGRRKGHIADLSVAETSTGIARSFGDILTFLGGALAAGGMLVLRACSQASASQILGAVGFGNPDTLATAVPVFGFCLQRRRNTPHTAEKYEFFSPSDKKEQDRFRRVVAILKVADRVLPSFVDDYYFLEKVNRDAFERNFRQACVWIVTDNLGFADARREVFPDEMFFTAGPMEILFWMRECVKEVSPTGFRDYAFDRELVGCCAINHELGFIDSDTWARWQDKFDFHFASKGGSE